MVRIITSLLFLLVVFACVWWLGQRRVEVQTFTRIDTVYYELPTPSGFTEHTISVNVPKWIFAEKNVASNDAASKDMVASNDDSSTYYDDSSSVDSVSVDVIERTIEYSDSTYYLRIRGPVVGSLVPRLDCIQTYARNTTSTQIVRERPRWEFGGEVAADLRNRYFGAFVSRNFGPVSLEASAGYDPFRHEPLLQAKAKFTLWRNE